MDFDSYQKNRQKLDSYGYTISQSKILYDDEYTILGVNRPKNSRWTNPYNYDSFIAWAKAPKRDDSVVYSDRLCMWDYEKYRNSINTVAEKHPRKNFDNKNSVQVEEFLSLYFDKKVKLTAIVEGCNASNGYPYWVFFYRETFSD